VFARTNTVGGGMGAADLDAIVCPELHCVGIPKTERAEDVVEFCALLAAAERRAGLPEGYTWVRPVIETALGVRNAFDIAAASPRVAYMGGVSGGASGDLGSSLGYTPMPDGSETFFVRSKVLVDVRAAGVRFPIGGGGMARRDMDGIRAFAVENNGLGYDGAHCAASREVVAIINEVFTPSQADVDHWVEILPILEQAGRDGVVVLRRGDEMLDIAGLVRMRERLALARRLGMIS
jgi:citrate lyase subunit beta/citryl-CoA lyase